MIEQVHSMSDYPRHITCPDHNHYAHLVIIHAPMFDIDKTSERGFDVGAGQVFSSRQERKDWMKSQNLHEADGMDVNGAMKEMREKKADLAASR